MKVTALGSKLVLKTRVHEKSAEQIDAFEGQIQFPIRKTRNYNLRIFWQKTREGNPLNSLKSEISSLLMGILTDRTEIKKLEKTDHPTVVNCTRKKII